MFKFHEELSEIAINYK